MIAGLTEEEFAKISKAYFLVNYYYLCYKKNNIMNEDIFNQLEVIKYFLSKETQKAISENAPEQADEIFSDMISRGFALLELQEKEIKQRIEIEKKESDTKIEMRKHDNIRGYIRMVVGGFMCVSAILGDYSWVLGVCGASMLVPDSVANFIETIKKITKNGAK